MELKTNPDEKDAYALIIGISTYKDSKIPRLNYTTHDAQAIFDLLVNPDIAGFKKENVKIFLDDEATLFNIKDTISNWLFKNAKEDSIVFIYFAGQGGVEEDRLDIEKDNLAKYLLLYDADFDNFFASALSNSDFNTLLLPIKSKRMVMFMNLCYSGVFTEKKVGDIKIVGDPYEKLAEGEGRLVIAASQPNQRSFEDENKGYGIFTYHLIEALKGAADFDNDGYVTAIEVYKYLSETVPKAAMRLAGGVQEPILRGDLKTDFVLTVNRKRLEEIKNEDVKKKNLKKLSDWYHDGKLGPAQYEFACRLIESSFEELSEDDKKVLRSLKDFLSGEISILTFLHSTFWHDVSSTIEGLEEPLIGKPKVEEEEKKRIVELNSQAQNLLEEKRYAEATAKWQEVLMSNPENRKADEGIKKAEEKLKEREWEVKEGKIKAEEKLQVKKYCPNCGYPNTRKLQYCVQCGAKLFGTYKAIDGIEEAERILKKIKERLDYLESKKESLNTQIKWIEEFGRRKEDTLELLEMLKEPSTGKAVSKLSRLLSEKANTVEDLIWLTQFANSRKGVKISELLGIKIMKGKIKEKEWKEDELDRKEAKQSIELLKEMKAAKRTVEERFVEAKTRQKNGC